jgi:hypothetical protein
VNEHTRQRQRNLTIVALYREGKIAAEISAEVGLTTRRVLQILQTYGITRRPRNTASVTGRSPTQYTRRNHQGFQNRAAKIDPEGEHSSEEPGRKLYACPGCGMRAENPLGHAQCVAKVA